MVRRRVWRPRVLIYGALLLGTSTAFVASLSLRPGFSVDVIKDRGAQARVEQGAIENVYRMHAGDECQRIAPELCGECVGLPGLALATPATLHVEPTGIGALPVRLTLLGRSGSGVRRAVQPHRVRDPRRGRWQVSHGAREVDFVPR